jgi:hypothetical protein
MDAPRSGAGSAPAHAWSRAMSRTLKDMRGGLRERRQRAVLSRQRARECVYTTRTAQTEVYGRHGWRQEVTRSTRNNTQEELI